MAEQELKQKFVVEGAEQAANKIGEVADAQESVGKVSQDAAPKVDRLADATDGLNVSEENLKNVLGQLSPQLAGLADGFINATKLAGQLGTKNIELNSLYDSGKKLVLKYQSTLLLLGAGSAAFLAVKTLADEWRRLKKEMEDAIKVAERFTQTERRRDERRERVRDNVIEEFAKTKPKADLEDIRKTTDDAVKLIEKLDIDPSRAVRIVTGQERLSRSEERFRQRVDGPGARRGEAREQLRSFDTVKSPFGTISDTADRGPQGALLEFIRKQFLEEGSTAQQRIDAAQRLIAAREDKSLATKLPPEEKFAGEELIRALGISVEEAAKNMGDAASTMKEAAEESKAAMKEAAEEAKAASRSSAQRAKHDVEAARQNALAAERMGKQRMRSTPSNAYLDETT